MRFRNGWWKGVLMGAKEEIGYWRLWLKWKGFPVGMELEVEAGRDWSECVGRDVKVWFKDGAIEKIECLEDSLSK